MFIKKQVRFIGLIAVCFCISLQATFAEPEEKDFTPEFVAQCTANAEAGDAEGLALYGRALANGWGVFWRVLLTQIDTAIWCRKAAELGVRDGADGLLCALRRWCRRRGKCGKGGTRGSRQRSSTLTCATTKALVSRRIRERLWSGIAR